MIRKIGTFKTNSDTIRITDPCYSKNVWCSGVLKNCEIGEWSAFIIYVNDEWGERVAQIIAIFGDISIEKSQKIIDEDNWKISNIDVGVDSGQCGIFEDLKYPEELGEYGDTSSFYGKCCELSASELQGGVLEFGLISSSGFGDGSYESFFVEKNKICAIKVVFIDDIYNLEEDKNN
jgi:hypothetical protein